MSMKVIQLILPLQIFLKDWIKEKVEFLLNLKIGKRGSYQNFFLCFKHEEQHSKFGIIFRERL